MMPSILLLLIVVAMGLFPLSVGVPPANVSVGTVQEFVPRAVTVARWARTNCGANLLDFAAMRFNASASPLGASITTISPFFFTHLPAVEVAPPILPPEEDVEDAEEDKEAVDESRRLFPAAFYQLQSCVGDFIGRLASPACATSNSCIMPAYLRGTVLRQLAAEEDKKSRILAEEEEKIRVIGLIAKSKARSTRARARNIYSPVRRPATLTITRYDYVEDEDSIRPIPRPANKKYCSGAVSRCESDPAKLGVDYCNIYVENEDDDSIRPLMSRSKCRKNNGGYGTTMSKSDLDSELIASTSLFPRQAAYKEFAFCFVVVLHVCCTCWYMHSTYSASSPTSDEPTIPVPGQTPAPTPAPTPTASHSNESSPDTCTDHQLPSTSERIFLRSNARRHTPRPRPTKNDFDRLGLRPSDRLTRRTVLRKSLHKERAIQIAAAQELWRLYKTFVVAGGLSLQNFFSRPECRILKSNYRNDIRIVQYSTNRILESVPSAIVPYNHSQPRSVMETSYSLAGPCRRANTLARSCPHDTTDSDTVASSIEDID